MRIQIFGCNIDALTMKQSLEKVDCFIRTGHPHQHVAVNVNKVLMAQKDQRLLSIINRCDLINCDGMPIVWASRILGKPLPERVAGIDLFTSLVERAACKGWRVFFLGTHEEIVTKAVNVFRARHPTLRLAGYRNGYWRPDQEEDVVNMIAGSNPDILFVAISSPKKERFLGKHLKGMNVPFAMGVGGAFDVVAGFTDRAPEWMQKSGLEWFFRFLQEPRRMFRRYFVNGPAFLALLCRELMKQKARNR